MEEKGIVTRRVKGFYYLRTDNGQEIECKAKGALFKKSRFDNQIAVGDKVGFIRQDADKIGLITGIEPRRSFLSRDRVGINAEQILAANIDYLLMTSSVRKPSFRLNFINRMLVAALAGNVSPVLVITKIDLADERFIESLVEPYRALGIKIIFFSTISPVDDSELLDILSNNTSALSGHSGVGKSSLLKKLFPSLSIKTRPVSRKTGKGSHATTHAVMHQVAEKGFVIDTPGIREFGFHNISEENLDLFYPLVQDYSHLCKHRDCGHVHEPGCAVKAAVESGKIHTKLYDGYISIYESLIQNRDPRSGKPRHYRRSK